MEITSLIRQGVKAGCRNWKRSGWLVAGIVLGVAFFITISSIGASYTALVSLPFSRIESDLLIQLGADGKRQIKENDSAIKLPFSNQVIDKNIVQNISELTEIQELDSAILLWHQEKKNFITITGVDKNSTDRGPAKVLQWISKGRSLQNSGETVVESHYARFHSLKPGATIHLGERLFHIVGISKIKSGAALAAANFYISLDDARELAGMDKDSVNLLSASLVLGTDKKAVTQQIQKIIPSSLVSSPDSIGEMMQGFARISSTASRLLSFITILFTLFFTCWLIVGRQEEQRWQIGLMQTIGWQKKDILLYSSAEIFTISAIAAIGGMVVGYLVIQGFSNMEVSLTLPWNLAPNPEGMHQMKNSKAIQVPLPVTLQPLVFICGFVATCFTAVITGVWNNYRLSRAGIRETLFSK